MNKDKYKQAADELRKITIYDVENNCEQLFCRLHGKEYLGTEQEHNHNCIACQLNEGNERLLRFLDETDTAKDGEYNFIVFILLTYLQVERLHILFRLIGISFEYVEENWPVLVEIRKWANFVKHPKGFLLTHHPSYILDSDAIPTGKDIRLVNFEFVSKLYFREDEGKFRDTMQKLSNKSDVLVVAPDPIRIIKEYSEVSKAFCEKIKSNPHFQEILRKHSTSIEYM